MFTVSWSLTDETGNAANGSTFVTVNPPLTGHFGTPLSSTVAAGVTVSLSVVASGGNGAYSFSWTFADGGTSSSSSASHAFASAGRYTIRVNVTDSLGSRVNLSGTLNVTGVSAPSALGSTLLIGGVAAAVLIGAVVVIVLRRRQGGSSADSDTLRG
ncbi:MAG: PKD domain-containing protein [Thermoplasmata archaeon]